MGKILTQPELCAWLQITSVTAWKWRKRYGLPHMQTVGRALRYDQAKVQRWFEQYGKGSTRRRQVTDKVKGP